MLLFVVQKIEFVSLLGVDEEKEEELFYIGWQISQFIKTTIYNQENVTFC